MSAAIRVIVALVCGTLFGIGLTVSQMVNPNKVFNFLDVAGPWDPSLMFVMVGGIAVFALGYFLLVKNSRQPMFAIQYAIPSRTDIDKPLVVGAILFGLGWGISGMCPGPAISNLSGLEPKIFGFLGMMVLGMKLSPFVNKRLK